MQPFSSPTVTAEWLTLHRRRVVVAEVHDGPHDFDGRGHLPGAVRVDTAAFAPSEGGRGLDPNAFAAALADAGIAAGDPVVVYDRGAGVHAAQLWWLLHVLGQPCAVLDGGLATWDGPLAATPERTVAEVRAVRPWPTGRFLGVSDALLWRRHGEAVVLDAGEAPGERGAGSTLLGARRAPWADNLEPQSGRFLPRLELRRRFEALGARHRLPVLAYSGSCAAACHLLLALELAAIKPTALVADVRHDSELLGAPVGVGGAVAT